jgi:hypothetical protein
MSSKKFKKYALKLATDESVNTPAEMLVTSESIFKALGEYARAISKDNNIAQMFLDGTVFVSVRTGADVVIMRCGAVAKPVFYAQAPNGEKVSI